MVKLTVIIPSYNVENFVSNALNSIKFQKVEPETYQVLIVDDGSIDNSEELIKDWIKSNDAKMNFKYIKKENGNWGSVINYVKNKRLIKGEYVTILDADDYYNEGCFENVYQYLDGKYDLVISNYYQNKEGKFKKVNVMFGNSSREIQPEEAHTGYSIPLCKFFKTSLFNKMEDLKEGVSYQDQILYHSFVLNCKNIYFINDCLGVYWFERIGSSSANIWTDKRVRVWAYNMNKLLAYNSKPLAAYVLMMIWYVKKNISKSQWKYFTIQKQNQEIALNAEFLWLPNKYRKVAKFLFVHSTKKIIKNNN